MAVAAGLMAVVEGAEQSADVDFRMLGLLGDIR
jgi:hypothetical protein